MTLTLEPGEAVGLVVALAGLLTALGYIGRRAYRFAQLIIAVHHIIDRELNHNHGSSIKDDVTGLTVAMGALSRQVDDIDDRLSDHLGNY